MSTQLVQLLSSAFTILERLFASIDADNAHIVTFPQLLRYVRADESDLKKLFQRVQKDGGETMDFSEFLVLMYLWVEVGPYDQLLRDRRGADTIKTAFEVMEKCYVAYDTDRSRQLSHDEFHSFMTRNMPEIYAQQSAVVQQLFPSSTAVLSFSRFLYLLYRCVLPQGRYSRLPADSGAAAGGGGAAASSLRSRLSRSFECLEKDFRMFDRDGSGSIDLAELTQGVSINRPSSERLDILVRMEYYFRAVDVDGSESIDFFEFMYLAFLITQNGSYRDLVDAAVDPAAVKECFTTLRADYKKYDADGSNRLTIDEVRAFLQGEFGSVPANTEAVFNKLKSSPDRPHIDFVRFLHLLYEIIRPDGPFVAAQAKKPAAKPNRQLVNAADHRRKDKPPRVNDVNIAEIHKGRLLGQGGQGTVYEAEYRGIKCGAKFLLQDSTPELCQETKEECDLMMRMDHENVHYLIGCRTVMPNICLLTELCSNGSLFDCYMKKRMRFDRPTQWRFARECALGINVLHEMKPAFMHRDIKSLNVFVDENFVMKVADFGMAKDPHVGPNYQGMGTPQWCAPEVLNSCNYDQRADLFSYGILLWEITHLQCPYAETGMSQTQIARAVTTQNLRPTISAACPPRMAALIRACWDREPAKRPSLRQVVQELDSLKDEFCSSRM